MYRIEKDFLTPNKYSRPRRGLKIIKGLVAHWVGNPGTTAKFNRDYFELRRNGEHGYGSAHFIIDPNHIIQCIPITEMAYHVGAKTYTEFALDKFGTYPNNCTIGIELCHINWRGKFAEETIDRAIWLFKKLSIEFGLYPIRDITTHYAITKKVCPKWFVDHPEDFEKFKINVNNYKEKYIKKRGIYGNNESENFK